jgi:hypothetical protein
LGRPPRQLARARTVRLRHFDETRAEHANRVRAAVVEGLAEPGRLEFADHLEGRR